jgi:hypothetical protein
MKWKKMKMRKKKQLILTLDNYLNEFSINE